VGQRRQRFNGGSAAGAKAVSVVLRSPACLLRRNKVSIKLRCVWHGRKNHEKAGAPSFALLVKGGIRDRRHRDSWCPTLRKKREGWGTRGSVAPSAEGKNCPASYLAGRQRRWMTELKGKRLHALQPTQEAWSHPSRFCEGWDQAHLIFARIGMARLFRQAALR
jgi:hypothetical protein